MKKYFIYAISIIACCVFWLLPKQSFAASVFFDHVPESVHISQEFYIDVLFDAESESFNAIEGLIAIPSSLTFVRAETANSIIPIWIERPQMNDNLLGFSGMIPGGFNGLYKPLDGDKKFPGTILRLVFRGETESVADIKTEKIIVALHNGQGTLRTLPNKKISIKVDGISAPEKYQLSDREDPTLTAEVFQSNDVFDGKYALMFVAADKESGIDRVEVKEGYRMWKRAESPYLLEDQTRKSILRVRAVDMAGNEHVVIIDPIESGRTVSLWFVLLISLIIVVLYGIHLYIKKKK